MDGDRLWARYEDLRGYLGWSEADLVHVATAATLVRPHIPALVADFYAEIERHDETLRVFTGGLPQVERLKATFTVWLEQLFAGTYDAAYVARRWQVGLRHVEIGLEEPWTNVALGRVRNGIVTMLAAALEDRPREFTAVVTTVNRLLDLDLAIIQAAYQHEYVQRLKRGQRLVAIGQMAAGIAHELRNPLNVVRTSAFYLKNARQLTPEKQAEHLERIERQTGLAEQVIMALSDFAKLPLPETDPVPIRRLVADVLSLREVPPGIEVELVGLDDCPPVAGDARQLAIVLGNLVGNAVDMLPAGGRLRIAASSAGSRVRLEISDNGPGLDPALLHRVFEPFYSTKVRGMGLGLAMCRAIVENHGGVIRASSPPGSGACFTVTLPGGDHGKARTTDSRGR
jgi:two-component system NtrC family sensor kinase